VGEPGTGGQRFNASWRPNDSIVCANDRIGFTPEMTVGARTPESHLVYALFLKQLLFNDF